MILSIFVEHVISLFFFFERIKAPKDLESAFKQRWCVRLQR
jgi:hypothetical protein